MNLIDAIRLYSHIIQQYGGGYDARKAAEKELKNNGFPQSIRRAIAAAVSNDGYILSAKGSKLAITQISSS